MSGRSSIPLIFPLVLFTLFAVSILLAVLLGAGAYGGVAERAGKGVDARLCASYLMAKIRGCDERGRVAVDEFGGRPALVLTEEYEGIVYETALYYHDGYLMELFSEQGLGLLPEDGERLLPVEGVGFSLEDGLITIEIQDGQAARPYHLYLRSGGEPG